MPHSDGTQHNSTGCDVLQYSDIGQFQSLYYAKNRPVVIRGVRAQAPLRIFQWSAQYFEEVLGETEVPVLSSETGFLSYERSVTTMPFRQFASRSFGTNAVRPPYYYFKNPTSILPPGHDDSELLEGLAGYLRKAMLRNLWISGSGLTVGLHFDHAENLNFQLRGHKAFFLYPPGVRAFYPLPMFSQTAHISGVYRHGPNPDLSKFPRFDPGSGIRVDLEEGDILYIPAYWWHQVQSLGAENLNLNFWWIPSIQKQLPNWNQALRGHAQLALRYLKFGSIQRAPAEKVRSKHG